MLHLYSINLLKCFSSIVKLFILCSLVFVNVSEKNYFNLSHKNIHYYLKLQIPMGHRLFFIKKIHTIVIKFKLIAITEETRFILHVANGIHITIQV